MPVSQHETALSRGRLPSYLCRQVHQLISVLLDQRTRGGITKNQLCLLSPGILYHFIARNHNRSSSHLLNSLLNALYYHFYSFDMYIQPTVVFNYSPLMDPVAELPATEFYELAGFWPGQFAEVSENLVLIPDQIICPMTYCTVSKQLALFVFYLCYGRRQISGMMWLK